MYFQLLCVLCYYYYCWYIPICFNHICCKVRCRLHSSTGHFGNNVPCQRGVIQSWDRTTLGGSFCHGIDRLQGSHSVLGEYDSRGVILSWDRTTPGESFCPRIEQFHGSHSVLGLNDSRGVILTWHRTTAGESICPGIERLQGSHSVLG